MPKFPPKKAVLWSERRPKYSDHGHCYYATYMYATKAFLQMLDSELLSECPPVDMISFQAVFIHPFSDIFVQRRDELMSCDDAMWHVKPTSQSIITDPAPDVPMLFSPYFAPELLMPLHA